MAFSYDQLRTWKSFNKTQVQISDWRKVASAAQAATATTGLPRYSKWGTSANGATTNIPNNATNVGIDKLQHAFFDAVQVRFRFHTTEPSTTNTANGVYWSPREVTIYNGGSLNINRQGDLSKRDEWVSIRDGSTQIMRVRGYYSGRYYQSGAWYGTNRLSRIYYDVNQAQRLYFRFGTSSSAQCGAADSAGLNASTGGFSSQTAEYHSIVIKNRPRGG